MTRSVDEWIGKDDDERPPRRVRLRVFDKHRGRCCLCGGDILLARDYECHHYIALINGGANRESNLRPAHVWCHRHATNDDVAEKSRVYRKRATHVVGRRPRSITRWRNFRGDIVIKPRQRF